MLYPYYVEVDRSRSPKCFIQAAKEEYNDILNNYRIPLASFQFKRSLFAKMYIYADNWSEINSFAFSRNPIDRCISSFFNLKNDEDSKKSKNYKFYLNKLYNMNSTLDFEFDNFLDKVEEAHCSGYIYKPYGLSFSTHTAPMWGDITDFDDNILVKYIFRLEDLVKGVIFILKDHVVPHSTQQVIINKRRSSSLYEPKPRHISKIEQFYEKDFLIYHDKSSDPDEL